MGYYTQILTPFDLLEADEAREATSAAEAKLTEHEAAEIDAD